MDRESAPGVLEVLTGNRKTIFGMFSLLLALVVAFSSIYRQTATLSRQGVADPGEVVNIEMRGLENEARLYAKGGKTGEGPAEIAFLDDQGKVVGSGKLSAGEAGLEIDGSASYFRVNSNDTRLNYEYEINYTYQPFRLLAIPAGLLTVFGVVALYRGFEEFMSNFAERRAKELEKEKSGGHVDFMGIDEEDVESDDEDGYK